MPQIPKISGFDNTLSLAREGNTFISKRCEQYRTDIFQTRLMLKNVVCLRGEEAAKVFYDTNLFKRQGAAPKRAQKTLFGQGGVQGLDGQAHRHRKQAFMSLMTPENIRSLVDEFTKAWQTYIPKWQARNQNELLYDASEIICRAACAWAGVGLKEEEVEERTHGFMALINSAGAVGPKHWRGRTARKKMNAWLGDVIQQIRENKLNAPEGSAAHKFATFRDVDGKFLDPKIAAVELNNVIRPTVATARFIAFAALALHEHPQWREKLQTGDDEATTLFVQEVRRFYPFFPAVAAIAKKDFDWHGYQIAKEQWVILDLYGTNFDARSWDRPEEFRPERFREWDRSPFNFVPQGGGDHHQNHRCAGEWVTIEIMKAALRMLTQAMEYDVPQQDLHVDRTKMPARPESGFLFDHVRAQQKTANQNLETQPRETAQSKPVHTT